LRPCKPNLVKSGAEIYKIQMLNVLFLVLIAMKDPQLILDMFQRPKLT